MQAFSRVNRLQPHLQLGPFQGITDVYYRNTFIQYFSGIDKLFTPFFSGIHKENSKSLRTPEIDPNLNDVKITIPQVLSNSSDEILRFSEQCAALGYTEINLNMGCPYPLVANKKRGSGLMPYSDMVAKMLDQLNNKLSGKMSIKCRLGYHTPNEIDDLLEMFSQFNLSELIVHARIGKQLYKGIVNADRFAELIPQIKNPLVYNGDIFSVEAFKTFQMKFAGVNGFMLGRGLLADPFLASDIKGITIDYTSEERKAKVQRFITELYLLRRKVTLDNPAILGRMKELWSYLCWSFDDGQAAWRLVKKVNTFDAYEEAVSRVFDELSWEGSGYAHHYTEE